MNHTSCIKTRCHRCPQGYSKEVGLHGSTYRIGLHCRLFGDVPVDQVPWRRRQNRVYDLKTREK